MCEGKSGCERMHVDLNALLGQLFQFLRTPYPDEEAAEIIHQTVKLDEVNLTGPHSRRQLAESDTQFAESARRFGVVVRLRNWEPRPRRNPN